MRALARQTSPANEFMDGVAVRVPVRRRVDMLLHKRVLTAKRVSSRVGNRSRRAEGRERLSGVVGINDYPAA